MHQIQTVLLNQCHNNGQWATEPQVRAGHAWAYLRIDPASPPYRYAVTQTRPGSTALRDGAAVQILRPGDATPIRPRLPVWVLPLGGAKTEAAADSGLSAYGAEGTDDNPPLVLLLASEPLGAARTPFVEGELVSTLRDVGLPAAGNEVVLLTSDDMAHVGPAAPVYLDVVLSGGEMARAPSTTDYPPELVVRASFTGEDQRGRVMGAYPFPGRGQTHVRLQLPPSIGADSGRPEWTIALLNPAGGAESKATPPAIGGGVYWGHCEPLCTHTLHQCGLNWQLAEQVSEGECFWDFQCVVPMRGANGLAGGVGNPNAAVAETFDLSAQPYIPAADGGPYLGPVAIIVAVAAGVAWQAVEWAPSGASAGEWLLLRGYYESPAATAEVIVRRLAFRAGANVYFP